MDNAPAEAPAPAPTGESEATPTTNTEPVQAPDMHGFTSDELADLRTFLDSNGGFSKVKSRISNPQPVEKPVENPQIQDIKPTSQPQAQPVEAPKFQRPEGARSLEEINTRRYFEDLAAKPQYAAIAKEIEDGSVLKEMNSLGIVAVNQDYSINEDRLLQFLDLKAKTVPAKPTESEPNASAAPTVDYVAVGDKIDNIDQAYQVIMQPNHPAMSKAEEFIKEFYSGKNLKK